MDISGSLFITPSGFDLSEIGRKYFSIGDLKINSEDGTIFLKNGDLCSSFVTISETDETLPSSLFDKKLISSLVYEIIKNDTSFITSDQCNWLNYLSNTAHNKDTYDETMSCLISNGYIPSSSVEGFNDGKIIGFLDNYISDYVNEPERCESLSAYIKNINFKLSQDFSCKSIKLSGINNGTNLHFTISGTYQTYNQLASQIGSYYLPSITTNPQIPILNVFSLCLNIL